jgi:hypothetical protein
MELNKAVEILMHNHRFKLGKTSEQNFTPQEINRAMNVLSHYNETQRRLNTYEKKNLNCG